jgi:hypothetical protein
MPAVLTCLQQRWRCEELGFLLRYNLGEVELLMAMSEVPTDNVVGVRRLLGTVESPKPHTLSLAVSFAA